MIATVGASRLVLVLVLVMAVFVAVLLAAWLEYVNAIDDDLEQRRSCRRLLHELNRHTEETP